MDVGGWGDGVFIFCRQKVCLPTQSIKHKLIYTSHTYTQAKRFCRFVGLTAASVYGGSGVGQQISELKRGAAAVACTPGRFIDVLVTR